MKQVEAAGHQMFGIFASLFGLAGNEIYLVTFGENQLRLELTDEVQLLSNHLLNPTIRPASHEPTTRPGVYVFRWFRVSPDSVDEIVHLSGEAWPTLERSFETKIQGLFVEATEQPSEMLLITWYKDLSVWEASRYPPSDARDNFLRRHQLTLSAKPIATLLTLPEGKSLLVSHA
ncbi:MAG: hypothetical protein O3C68_05730 [Proteobacteria bacterium]|nr:hypothetical protein [Pseudomonadota bacterium]